MILPLRRTLVLYTFIQQQMRLFSGTAKQHGVRFIRCSTTVLKDEVLATQQTMPQSDEAGIIKKNVLQFVQLNSLHEKII